MKPLDMADKYPPAEDFDDEEITIKVQVPTFHDQVIVSGENADFDLHGERDTIPSPPSYPEDVEGNPDTRYPGVGLLLCLVTGVAFWGTVTYFLFR